MIKIIFVSSVCCETLTGDVIHLVREPLKHESSNLFQKPQWNINERTSYKFHKWLDTAINIKCKCIQQKETNNSKNKIARISKVDKKQQKQRETREKIINQNKN